MIQEVNEHIFVVHDVMEAFDGSDQTENSPFGSEYHSGPNGLVSVLNL